MFLSSYSSYSSMQADDIFLDSQPVLFLRRQTCGGLQTNRKLTICATISPSNRMHVVLPSSAHSALAKFLSERYRRRTSFSAIPMAAI